MPLGNAVGVPLINGVSYTHADIVLNILGTPIVGCTQVQYAEPQEITLNHSTGVKPTSRGFGAMTPEATITLTLEAVQAIQLIAPDGKIQNIPSFDIGINYTTVDGAFVRHALRNVRFKGRNLTSAVNNSQIEETLELSVAEIDWNAV